jgi:murein DD-endopeptidase MepM/ murein hydrolase activator NlpD
VSGLARPYAGTHAITQGFTGLAWQEPPGWLSPDHSQARLQEQGGWAYRLHLHGAQDVALPTGTPLLAPEAGIIVAEGTIVRFRNGQPDGEHYQLLMIHRDAELHTIIELTHEELPFTVGAGSRVRRGQAIGLSDSSGVVTGPHLHWQVCTGPSWASPAAIVWGGIGIRHDPSMCLTGGEKAGAAWLVPNV